jgi:hypothetical protein
MLSKTLSVVSFFGALAIGVAAAYSLNVWSDGAKFLDGLNSPVPTGESVSWRFNRVSNKRVRVHASDLIGRWRGEWGYGDKEAMIYIDRVEGSKVYGNLTVHGALIALEGTVDPDGIRFRETKVLSIDKSLGEWSLGDDHGTFSSDSTSMFGTGQDEYGVYQWSMTKEK